jgi:hypothetical protein
MGHVHDWSVGIISDVLMRVTPANIFPRNVFRTRYTHRSTDRSRTTLKIENAEDKLLTLTMGILR